MKPKFLPNSGLARTGKQTGSGALTTGSGDFVPPAQTDGEQWRIADADYRRLRDVVYELSAIDLMHYRTQQMERRLTSYLERSGKETWGAYSLSLPASRGVAQLPGIPHHQCLFFLSGCGQMGSTEPDDSAPAFAAEQPLRAASLEHWLFDGRGAIFPGDAAQ